MKTSSKTDFMEALDKYTVHPVPEGYATAVQIAGRLGFDRNTGTRIVKRLSKHGPIKTVRGMSTSRLCDFYCVADVAKALKAEASKR